MQTAAQIVRGRLVLPHRARQGLRDGASAAAAADNAFVAFATADIATAVTVQHLAAWRQNPRVPPSHPMMAVLHTVATALDASSGHAAVGRDAAVPSECAAILQLRPNPRVPLSHPTMPVLHTVATALGASSGHAAVGRDAAVPSEFAAIRQHQQYFVAATIHWSLRTADQSKDAAADEGLESNIVGMPDGSPHHAAAAYTACHRCHEIAPLAARSQGAAALAGSRADASAAMASWPAAMDTEPELASWPLALYAASRRPAAIGPVQKLEAYAPRRPSTRRKANTHTALADALCTNKKSL